VRSCADVRSENERDGTGEQKTTARRAQLRRRAMVSRESTFETRSHAHPSAWAASSACQRSQLDESLIMKASGVDKFHRAPTLVRHRQQVPGFGALGPPARAVVGGKAGFKT